MENISIKERFIGTWELLAMSSVADDGTTIYPMGKEVKGLLAYFEDGTMSAQLGSLTRSKFLNPDYRKGSSEEIIESFNNYISYFGEYKINIERGFIFHDVKQSLFPNWIGTKVKRYYNFEGNFLTLKATPISYSGKLMTPTLNWRKK